MEARTERQEESEFRCKYNSKFIRTHVGLARCCVYIKSVLVSLKTTVESLQTTNSPISIGGFASIFSCVVLGICVFLKKGFIKLLLWY